LLSYDTKGQVLETGLNSLVTTVRKDHSGDACPPVPFPSKGPFLISTKHTHRPARKLIGLPTSWHDYLLPAELLLAKVMTQLKA